MTCAEAAANVQSAERLLGQPKMSKVSPLVVFVICLSIGLVAICKDASVPRSEAMCQISGMTFTASMDSRLAKSAKKVPVLLKLENNSEHDLYTTAGPGIHVEVFTHDDHPVGHTPFGESEAENNHPTVVKPRKSTEFEYDIRSRFRIDKPDLYKVVIKFDYNDQDDNGWGQLEVSVPFFVGSPPTPWKQPPGGV